MAPKYVQNSINPGKVMYVGFCFEIILEGGYGDDSTITGSLPLLLLALTQGSLQVIKNRGISHGLMDSNFVEDPSQCKTKQRKQQSPFIGSETCYITYFRAYIITMI